MSIWDSVKKFTRPYGDDEYDDYDDDDMDGYEEEAPRRSRATATEPESTGYTAPSTPGQSSTRSGFNGQVLNMNAYKQEVVLFYPSCFNDCTKAADDLREKKGIIVNLEKVDKALSRRVVDFLTGCAYALDGKVTKIAYATYLFSPNNMNVSGSVDNPPSEADSYI